MAFIGPIEERLAIREFYGANGDASTRGDVEAWLDCWAEGGQWVTHFFTKTGREELREQWDTLWENFDKVVFLCDIGAIEVNGDSAKCRCTVREIISLKSGGVYKLGGCYDDLLIKEQGKWRFQRRDYHLLVEELPA